MKELKVLAVDDHDLLLEGIVRKLCSHEKIGSVDKTNDPLEAVIMLKVSSYDMLITDYEMPALNGKELILMARKIQPKLKVIVLTMHDESFIVKQLMELKVDGYVLKKDMPRDLNLAITEIARDGGFFSADVNHWKKEFEMPENNSQLSGRELEILRLMVKEYSTPEIAQRLYINPKTVETHEKNLIRKLKTRSKSGLVKYVIDHQLLS
ncbi:MAG: response regulator transcription factor [Cyclobacteriaceae bacterium]